MWLMILCVLLLSVQTICLKLFNSKFMKSFYEYAFYNFLLCLSVFLIYFATMFMNKMEGVFFGASSSTVILAILFGSVFTGTMYFYIKAMETGPLSITVLLMALSLIVPVTFSILFLGESITLKTSIALIFIVAIFIISTRNLGSDRSIKHRSWFFYCLICFISNGSIGTIQKFHQYLLPGQEIQEFLIISFATAVTISLFAFLAQVKKLNKGLGEIKKILVPLFFVLSVGAGVATSLVNILMLKLSPEIIAIVLFPFINGGAIIMNTLTGVLLFKEKLTLTKYTILFLGIITIVLLSI